MSVVPFPSPLRRRWFLFQTETDKLLAASALFSCVLVAARILHSGRLTFVFLIWNLFLAWVPYRISSVLMRMDKGAVRVVGLIVWLLFIPNSFYILTDLYHLADGHRNARVPEWFDLALILSFAWNGLLLGALSLRQVERMIIPRASLAGRWVVLYPVMWLNALGVYIGRDLRYNSWDIVARPVGLFGDIVAMIVHPFRHHMAWGMIFCFSILLTFIYTLLTNPRELWKI